MLGTLAHREILGTLAVLAIQVIVVVREILGTLAVLVIQVIVVAKATLGHRVTGDLLVLKDQTVLLDRWDTLVA